MGEEVDDPDPCAAIDANLFSASSTEAVQPLYSPLDPSRREIRLLRHVAAKLQGPDQSACSLHFKLITASLDDDPIYDALSWCWASAEDPIMIRVNGHRLSIRSNLWDILECFVMTNDLIPDFWIDAACINQGDLLERNSQVGLMRTIYPKARTVRIWLGAMTGEHANLSAFLDKASNGEAALDLLSEDDGSKQGLLCILSAPWWSRLWVIQEARLANAIVLHAGDLSITWHALKITLSTLLSFIWGVNGHHSSQKQTMHGGSANSRRSSSSFFSPDQLKCAGSRTNWGIHLQSGCERSKRQSVRHLGVPA